MQVVSRNRTPDLVAALLAMATVLCAFLLPACGSTSSNSTCSPCQHPLAEPGYPWPGTETVTRIEYEQGPLQR